jgi:hypothetical protein
MSLYRAPSPEAPSDIGHQVWSLGPYYDSTSQVLPSAQALFSESMPGEEFQVSEYEDWMSMMEANRFAGPQHPSSVERQPSQLDQLSFYPQDTRRSSIKACEMNVAGLESPSLMLPRLRDDAMISEGAGEHPSCKSI